MSTFLKCLAGNTETECYYSENSAVYKSTRKPIGNPNKDETGKQSTVCVPIDRRAAPSVLQTCSQCYQEWKI